ncbi:MAG: hypothetical protein HFG08_09930 [Oscillibacter sp.]|nr:hypothetical protein [Oscillibacter sp.]
MREIDQLRPLTAGRLLSLWQACREETEDPLERALLCNAGILAACCFFRGEPVFRDRQAVLEGLTGRQMETLLRRLSGEDGPAAPGEVNPAFDQGRFDALKKG